MNRLRATAFVLLATSFPFGALADRTPATDSIRPRVQLISAGREPRIELRYRPTAGDSRLVVTTVESSATEQVGNATFPESRTRVRWTAGAEILDVSPEGIVRYRHVVRDFDLEGADERGAAVAEERLGATRGLVEEGRIDARGLPIDDAAAGRADDGGAPAFADLLVPLPAEPVGPGAQWRVVRRIERAGVEMESIMILTFEKERPDGILLDARLDAKAPPRKFIPPGGAESDALMLEELLVAGSAKTLLDLSFPAPFRSNENQNYRLRARSAAATEPGSEVAIQTLSGSVRREAETNPEVSSPAEPGGAPEPESAESGPADESAEEAQVPDDAAEPAP